MFLKGYRFFGGAISFYRVLLFSAPSFTFISHRVSGSGSTSSSGSTVLPVEPHEAVAEVSRIGKV